MLNEPQSNWKRPWLDSLSTPHHTPYWSSLARFPLDAPPDSLTGRPRSSPSRRRIKQPTGRPWLDSLSTPHQTALLVVPGRVPLDAASNSLLVVPGSTPSRRPTRQPYWSSQVESLSTPHQTAYWSSLTPVTMFLQQKTDLLNDTMRALVESEQWQGENLTSNATARRPCDRTQLDMFSLRFVCDVILATPLVALGIVANIVAFIVLCRQKNRMTTTVLLQALAVCDTLILVCILLLRCLVNIHLLAGPDTLETYINEYYAGVFVYLFPVVYFLRLADTWLTTLLTVDRYIAVCHPLHVHRLCTLSRAYKNMATVAVLALAFSAPRFFERRLVNNCFGFAATHLLKDNTYTIVYQVALFSVVMYIVPMSLLVGMNGRLLWELRRANIFRATLPQTSQSARQMMSAKKSVTLIVVTVVLVCIACNLTAVVVHLLWSLHQCFPSLRFLEAPRRRLAHVSNVMVTLNSAVNFFIYCLCSRNFRAEFVRMFHCQRIRRNTGSSCGSGRSIDGTQLTLMCSACGKRNSAVAANGALCRACSIKMVDVSAFQKKTNKNNGTRYERAPC